MTDIYFKNEFINKDNEIKRFQVRCKLCKSYDLKLIQDQGNWYVLHCNMCESTFRIHSVYLTVADRKRYVEYVKSNNTHI